MSAESCTFCRHPILYDAVHHPDGVCLHPITEILEKAREEQSKSAEDDGDVE